jgi:sulfite exporter TauE/SafE
VTTLVLAVLAASLLGSLHCAGMCGGLIAAYAGADASRGLARGSSHLAYNLGRLASYAALGALAGLAGRALDLAGTLAGAQRAALGVAGLLILAWGVYALLQALGARVPRVPVPPPLQRTLGAGLRVVGAWPPAARAGAIGLLTALLPCGWLYAFVVTAAGTGGALRGALVMAVFWAGTLPVMTAVGFGLQALAGPLRRHVPVACAVALMAVGLITVLGRLRILDIPLPSPPSSVAEAVAQAGDARPACCEPEPGARK